MATTYQGIFHASREGVRTSGHFGIFANLVKRIVTMLEIKRERNQLARMNEAQLRDIGVDRLSARLEAERPIWDLPSGRPEIGYDR